MRVNFSTRKTSVRVTENSPWTDISSLLGLPEPLVPGTSFDKFEKVPVRERRRVAEANRAKATLTPQPPAQKSLDPSAMPSPSIALENLQMSSDMDTTL